MELGELLKKNGDALFVIEDGGRGIAAILRVPSGFVRMPTTVDVGFAEGAMARQFTVRGGWNAKDWAALPDGHPAKAPAATPEGTDADA